MKKKKIDFAEKFADILIGIMMVVMVGIMPPIVRAVMRVMPPEIISMMGRDSYADVFSYYKGFAVYVVTGIIVFYWVSDAVTTAKMPDFKEFFGRVPIKFACVYIIFMMLSVIFAAFTGYGWTALFGTYTRGEGMFMWLSYFIVFITAMYFVRGIGYARVIIYSLAFSSIFMGAIGVGQLLGYDFFNTQLAALMVVGRGGSISPAFDIAHGTLFNPNTFGKYTAMVSPILLLAALTYDGKKYVKALLFLAGGLMLLSVFGSSSLGGLIGIVTAVGVLLVTVACGFVYKKEDSNVLKKIAISTAAVVAVIIIAILVVPPLNNRVTFLFNRMAVAMRAETVSGYDYHFTDDTMTVYRAGERMYSFTLLELGNSLDGGIIIRDAVGNEIPAMGEPTPPIVNDEGAMTWGPVYSFYLPGYRVVTVVNFGQAVLVNNYFLTLVDDVIYGVWPNNNELINMQEEVPAWGFYGRETWGSSRGYIWSRSFPLMPRRTIIGTGPDTFINVFPVYDLIGTQRFFYNPGKIVDKAHNVFIQTWITTGGISAIALFGLFGHYLFTTFISLVKSKNEELFSYGLRLGLLTGISAFTMSSMATDSTIGSTGVFFVLLGMGYGLNKWQNKPNDETKHPA